MYQCELNFRPTDFRLPALTRLALSDVHITTSGVTWPSLLDPKALPALVDVELLALQTPVQTDPSRTRALEQLAPQLTSLWLNRSHEWLGIGNASTWSKFTSLKHLRVTELWPLDMTLTIGQLVQDCLRSLPCQLESLNVATRQHSFNVTAFIVCTALRKKEQSVRKLKTIYLPLRDGLNVADPYQAFNWQNAHAELERLARSRGIKVKYRDFTSVDNLAGI